MILTDMYVFDKLPDVKSKTRLDCTKSTKSYPELEQIRSPKDNKLFFHFMDNYTSKQKTDKVISKTKHISSVFIPDLEKNAGYGDFAGTNDALLFVFSRDFTTFDMYVARGQKNNVRQLYMMLIDGELDDEMESLNSKLIKE